MTIGGHSDEQCRGVLQGEVEAHERCDGHRGHDWDYAGIPEVKLGTWFKKLYTSMIFLRMGVSQGGRGGTVVQTSSICGLWSGVMPQDGHVEHVYTAAKFGLIGLTRHG